MPRDTCAGICHLELLATALRSLATSPEMSDAQGEAIGQLVETSLGLPTREALQIPLGRHCTRCRILSDWLPYDLLPSCLMVYPKELTILLSTWSFDVKVACHCPIPLSHRI